jgi:hypothetical protein
VRERLQDGTLSAIETALTAMWSPDASGPRGSEIDRYRRDHLGRSLCSVRGECVDHVVVFGERHFRHLLFVYKNYYNVTHTHLSLSKDAPSPRAVQATDHIISLPILGGLHCQYRGI